MLPVVDPTCTQDSACEPSIAPGGEFTAGGSGTDACFGDSGGPVYISTPRAARRWSASCRAALAVIGEPCGDGGVYVRADKVVRVDREDDRPQARRAARATRPRTARATAPTHRLADDAGGCSATRGVVGGGALLGLVVLTVLCAVPASHARCRSTDRSSAA